VNARSTGTPAATKAPKAMSRMRNVIGTESFSAFWKSLPIVSFSSLFALAKPNSATVNELCAFWSFETRSITGWTCLSDLLMSPLMSNCTS